MALSAKKGWAAVICDLMLRCTDAFTWVDVETSSFGSNFLNMVFVVVVV